MKNLISSKMRMQLLSLGTIVILSFIAEKCRELVGKDYSSRPRSGTRAGKERFTFLDCFDMSYGTIACLVKELVKLYLYYIRAAHVQKVRTEATEKALAENLSQGRSFEVAMSLARDVGNTSARRASLQAKYVIGPTISSGWDLFETLYIGGSIAEGIVRSIGTLLGAYAGGIAWEGKIGWLGFLIGSQLGSWAGGRIGLMAYDVWIGIHYLLRMMSLNTPS